MQVPWILSPKAGGGGGRVGVMACRSLPTELGPGLDSM